MTTPIVSGFPDFGRYVARSLKVYGNTTYTNVTGTQNFGPFFVGDVEWVALALAIFIQGVSVTVEFYQDQATTLFLQQHGMQFRPNDLFSRPIPVLGPWMLVHMVPFASPWTGAIQAWQSHGPHMPFLGNGEDTLLSEGAAVNCIVGSTDFQCGLICPGDAVITCELPGVASAIEVYSTLSDGTFRRVTRFFGNNISGQRTMFLPATHAFVRCANGGPGVQPFTWELSASGRWPGT